MFSTICYAQIGHTKDEILNKNPNAVFEYTDTDIPYLVVEKDMGNYIQQQMFFLSKKDYKCYRYAISEPATEANLWVKFFNKEGYVKVDKLMWKNYATSLVYTLSIKGDFCFVVTDYDFNDKY